MPSQAPTPFFDELRDAPDEIQEHYVDRPPAGQPEPIETKERDQAEQPDPLSAPSYEAAETPQPLDAPDRGRAEAPEPIESQERNSAPAPAEVEPARRDTAEAPGPIDYVERQRETPEVPQVERQEARPSYDPARLNFRDGPTTRSTFWAS